MTFSIFSPPGPGQSWWNDYQTAAAGGKDALWNWMHSIDTGERKYADWTPDAASWASNRLAEAQDHTRNIFGYNMNANNADRLGSGAAQLGKLGMIVGGAIAGGTALGAAGAGAEAGAAGGAGAAGAGAGAGAGAIGAADAGVYGLSGIESAAAPGFTYGTAGAGGLGGATGVGTLAGTAGADTLAGTAAAAGPGEWADMSSWLGADATGAPAYDATTASVNDALNAGAAGGTGAAGATGAGAAGAAGAGGGSALSRLTGGNADMINLAGTLGAAGLGAYGANEYSNRLKEIYDDMASKREPYRQQSLAWLNDPSSYVNGPGAASLDATLRRLSVGGNPISDPTKLGIATQAGLQNWQNAVTGMGNLGLSGEDARASVASNAAGAANDVYTNLGAGLGALTRPKRTLADYIGGLV